MQQPEAEGLPFTVAPDLTTLLLDLDGTLVAIDQKALGRGLLLAGSRRFASIVPPWRFRSTYTSALAIARANATASTNHEVFLRALMARTRRPERVEGLVKEFVTGDIARLQRAFAPMPGARELVVAARALGYELVLATNPLWPLAAVQLRLHCAGLGDIRFRFIAHSEVATRCKPSADYYRELLAQSSVSATECVMIGNDPERDLAAMQLGIRTFLVTASGPNYRIPAPTAGSFASGTLPYLLGWLVASRLARTQDISA